ncbi:MAG: hypothetical protein ABID63_11580 [Pseudomonadota bacterium]
MAEIEDDAPSKPSPPTNGSVALFLSLYLLLLAFFILLNTISTFEEVKTRKVQESLSSAFASILPPTTSLQTVTSIEGPVLSAEETQNQIGILFQTAIKIVRVQVIQPGKLMEVMMHVDQLFEQNSILVRTRQGDFMARLAEILADDGGLLRYEMEMVMGAEVASRGVVEVANSLEIGRAGAFARELIDQGAPEDAFFVGLDPGADPFIVTFRFFWDERIPSQSTPPSIIPAVPGTIPGTPDAAPVPLAIPPATPNNDGAPMPLQLVPPASGGNN